MAYTGCMGTRVGKRIEVRLDEAHRRKLERILECHGTTVSEFVRAAIETEERKVRLQEFRKLIDEARADPLDVPADPAELKRELEAAHNPFAGKLQFEEDFPWMFED